MQLYTYRLTATLCMSKCIKTGDFLILILIGYISCTFFDFFGLVLSTTLLTSACKYRDLPYIYN